MKQHYNQLATQYHKAYFYTQDSDYEKWLLDQILITLSISSNHSVCDLGGGTGRFAHLIHQAVKLKQPVTCVDSAQKMLQQQPTVQPICMNMEEFVSTEPLFDRILIKEAIHHVSIFYLEPFFKHIYAMLQPDGKLLIVTRPKYVDYPIPDRAKTVWASTQLDAQVYVDALHYSGFESIVTTVHEFSVELEKTEWFQMIRARMWSVFSEEYFTEQELETWIQECSDWGEKVTITDRLIFICALK